MTVSSATTPRVVQTGNGVTTAVSFPYYFAANSWLVVLSTVIATGVETTLVLDTDYTVTGAGNSNGGTVTLTTAPAATKKITVYRDPPRTQTSDYSNNDPLDVEGVLEPDLDKLTMLVQRIYDLTTRSVRLSDGDVSGASPVLSTPVASSFIGWDSNGTALTTYELADLDAHTVTSFIATLLDDTTAAAARVTLDAQQNVFSTRGDLAYAGAAAAETALAIGTSGKVLESDGTDPGWQFPKAVIAVTVVSDAVALATGTAKRTFRMPFAMTLTSIRASLATAQSSGSVVTVDVNEAGTSIISTKLTFDNSEATTTTAATPAVISDSALADDALMTIDIDQIGGGTAKGLIVYLIGRRAS